MFFKKSIINEKSSNLKIDLSKYKKPSIAVEGAILGQ
jgi:hypothetical protein